METIQKSFNARAVKFILSAGLVTGFLDGLAAVLHHLLAGGNNPAGIYKFIASCLIGTSAFSGGLASVFLGIIIHFMIATFFSTLYFFTFSWWKKLSANKIINGLVYGIFVWIVMSYGVLYLIILKTPIQLSATNIGIGILIHMFCVGLPISLVISNYYSQKMQPDF
jgi:hypothetical protein